MPFPDWVTALESPAPAWSMLASLLLPFWEICARLWLPGLGDRGGVAGTLLSDQCHQVAALLQDVGFLITARLDDATEQRLAVLLQQRNVGLAVLIDQCLLANRWW